LPCGFFNIWCLLFIEKPISQYYSGTFNRYTLPPKAKFKPERNYPGGAGSCYFCQPEVIFPTILKFSRKNLQKSNWIETFFFCIVKII